jgi:hypothetical protein
LKTTRKTSPGVFCDEFIKKSNLEDHHRKHSPQHGTQPEPTNTRNHTSL